jgi:pimeloyl-ACP methyl ester carboxylesterase
MNENGLEERVLTRDGYNVHYYVAWHEREPTGELHTLPDAGHCASMDNAPAFNEVLCRFIESHE